MINSLSSRTAVPVTLVKTSKAQGTAKNAMTDGFIERIKAYAKEDAKKGVYLYVGGLYPDAAYTHETVCFP